MEDRDRFWIGLIISLMVLIGSAGLMYFVFYVLLPAVASFIGA